MPNSPFKILVVAAHPDDEVLGMGGTIRWHTSKGSDVTVLFLTDGVSAREVERESAESRRIAAKRALSVLGCEDIYFGQFPDNALDSIPQLHINKWIEEHIKSVRPTIVYTHFVNDLNVDHCIAAKATLVACRPKPESLVRELYHFEVPSSTGWRFGSRAFDPRYFVDITTLFDSKVRALEEYAIEIEHSPNARSMAAIDAQSVFRGSMVGMFRAEAFEIGFVRVDGTV